MLGCTCFIQNMFYVEFSQALDRLACPSCGLASSVARAVLTLCGPRETGICSCLFARPRQSARLHQMLAPPVSTLDAKFSVKAEHGLAWLSICQAFLPELDHQSVSTVVDSIICVLSWKS